MTFVPIHPEVGIVFKKKDGTTFTQWYSSTENNENNWQTVNEWIADALILNRLQALPEDRIMGVETGGCPHTAIREDASINLAAVDEMVKRHPGLDVIFIESGGDNLAATFSPDLADISLYVISVCQGEKIPRKGGPAITRSDLLIINKADLAPHVMADLDVMESDTRRVRGTRPYVFTDLLRQKGVNDVVAFIERAGGLA